MNPTYRSILDHTEAVLIEYEPEKISYEDLLVDWARQINPYGGGGGNAQYRSAVWYTSDEQRKVAEGTVEGIRAAARGRTVYADVEPATKFYRAEEYHQDFVAKQGRRR